MSNKYMKEFNIFKEKWGINAYEDIMTILSHMDMKIDELKKSRALWRKKFEELRDGIKT